MLFICKKIMNKKGVHIISVCPICNKSFETEVKMKKHQRAHSAKKHKCPDCGKMFVLLNKLKIHSLCHSPFAEFLCSLCGKRFKRRDKLKDHIKRMHSLCKETKFAADKPKPPRIKRYKFHKISEEQVSGSNYSCNFCGVLFNRRGILVNHTSKMHPDILLESLPQLCRPVFKVRQTFKCHFCSKVYLSNGKRKNHILKHHTDCDTTSLNRFKDTTDIGRVEIAPKSCSLCPRQFLTNAKLLQHMRKNHNFQIARHRVVKKTEDLKSNKEK